MVDHFRGDGTLARKFHDHIQFRCRAKNNFIPVLSVSDLHCHVLYSAIFTYTAMYCIVQFFTRKDGWI